MIEDRETARRARLDALLGQALDLPAAERAGYLGEACADEPELVAEVEELLRLALAPGPDLQPGDLASGPLWAGFCRKLENESEPELRGEQIGPWRLVREIGRGGMGTVYLAERADGEFQQTAALKLVRTSADSGDLMRRFEIERQILASFQHPSIARLLDGGRTESGRPYFAMEYVEGEAIDVHCHRRDLPLEDRLELFVRVGRAVQHAHANLVVHRDLKPANIVVTAGGEVKLLDFGVAKVLAPERRLLETPTQTMARVLTPDYASPEQVRGDPIATASDVYQLGLLLYELLTGERAHRFEDNTLATWERVVCEEPVTRPSEAAAAARSASGRGSMAARRSRKLRGDLDNIVLMALRKEPHRRYSSAAELVEDVERYLHGLPVRARTDTLTYRAGKLVRRHPFGVAASFAFAVLLGAYAVTVTEQARQLAAERDHVELEARKARKVSDFLVGLFEAADPIRTKGDSLTAGELVEAGIEQARSALAGEPEVKAELLGVLGKVSLNLSRFDRAELLTSEALALQRTLHPSGHPDLAAALDRHAEVLRLLGRAEESVEGYREALQMRRRLVGNGHPEVASSLSKLGYAVLALGRQDEGEELLRRALAIYRGLQPDYQAELASTLNRLAIAARRGGRAEESVELHREALALRREVFGADHPEVATSLNNLASTLFSAGRFEEAEPLNREAVAMTRNVVGDGHALLVIPLLNLGKTLQRLGKLAEAEAAQREALSIRRSMLGDDHPAVADAHTQLGRTLEAAGRHEQAEESFRLALAIYRSASPPEDAAIARAAFGLGRLLAIRGRCGAADPLLAEALAIHDRESAGASAETAEARVRLGLCRVSAGRGGDARMLLESGVAALRATERSDPELLTRAQRALATLR